VLASGIDARTGLVNRITQRCPWATPLGVRLARGGVTACT
jgi:hypothetical protein